MKVSELIEELLQLPQELEVTIWHHSNGFGYGPRDRAPRPKVRPSHLTYYHNIVPSDGPYGPPGLGDKKQGERVFL